MPPDPARPDSPLRLAVRDDARAIAEMARDQIEHGLGWSWTRARVLRSVAHPHTNVVVADRLGALAGFGIMKYDDEEAHLLLLAVRPEAQRLGIGRGLVGWLEASARVAGIGRIVLEARLSNAAARAFYQRLGYAAREILPGYYSGKEASVRMVKEPATALIGGPR